MNGLLSGAEDLVPVLKDCDVWVRHLNTRNIDGLTGCIQRYRPRIEGLFARIADPPASTQPNRYFMESLLALQFEYSRADIDETDKETDTASLESLPYGLQGFQQAPVF
jgi:hypothetical protein